MTLFPRLKLLSWYSSAEGRRRIEHGKDLARTSNLAIVGVARDCAAGLKQLRPQIEKLRSCFDQSFVAIYENDSKDSTKQELRSWQKNSPKIYLNLEQHGKTRRVPSYCEERIDRMARCRNSGLDLMEDATATSGILPDYVLIVDWDLRSLPANGVLAALADIKSWDVITANGLAYRGRGYRRIVNGFRYYDTYALGVYDVPLTEKAIFENWDRYAGLRPGAAPVKVISAFGGAALYRAARLKNYRYGILHNDDPTVKVLSEHSFLHRQMETDQPLNLCIHPSLLAFYERPWDVTLGRTLRRWQQSFKK